MAQASLPSSPITLLMQRYQASGLDPEFSVRRVDGADHSPIFEASVEVVEGLVARGTGVSKRAARSQAAANMLNQLGPEPKPWAQALAQALGPKAIETINKKKKQQVQAVTASALLASELGTLVINPKHSDVMLKCPGKTFLCHKAILASRSPFFDKMFTSNNNNSNMKQSKLEVKEFTVETIECVLEFLYSGEVKREVGDAVELVKAGVHFQVAGIINLAFRVLSRGISISMERMRVEAGEAIKDDEETGAVAMVDNGLMEKLAWVQKLHQDLALTNQ